MYTTYCPQCGQKHNYRGQSADTITRCQRCGAKFSLPRPQIWPGLVVVGLVGFALITGWHFYRSSRAAPNAASESGQTWEQILEQPWTANQRPTWASEDVQFNRLVQEGIANGQFESVTVRPPRLTINGPYWRTLDEDTRTAMMGLFGGGYDASRPLAFHVQDADLRKGLTILQPDRSPPRPIPTRDPDEQRIEDANRAERKAVRARAEKELADQEALVQKQREDEAKQKAKRRQAEAAQKREDAAASVLSLAKDTIKEAQRASTGRDEAERLLQVARRRLESIAENYPDTKAAAEAKKLLEGIK